MKIILTAIVLLSSLQYAHADISLNFSGLPINDDNPAYIYSIKGQQLKFTAPTEGNTSLYDAEKEEFISLEQKSGKRSMLNKQRLQLRVNQLNIERLKTLTEVEEKLRKELVTMNTAQQHAAETLLNAFKYPEFYGEHTSLIVKPMKKSKVVNSLNCTVYQLYKITDLLKTFCFADAKDLKFSEREYKTLRSFYAFNYYMQSQILIAMGNTKFSLIDFDQHEMSGVLIEEISYQKSARPPAKIAFHSQLKKVDYTPLKEADFSLDKAP